MSKLPLVSRQVKPLFNSTRQETRIQVLNLYKNLLHALKDTAYCSFFYPRTYPEIQQQVREEFLKNKDVSDLRLINIYVFKGNMLQMEIMKKYMPCGLISNYFTKYNREKPTNFLTKFYSGHES